jgi:hypothetical protein
MESCQTRAQIVRSLSHMQRKSRAKLKAVIMKTSDDERLHRRTYKRVHARITNLKLSCGRDHEFIFTCQQQHSY